MYQWLVFLHLVGLVLFLLAHGVSIFCSFHVRRQRDARLIAGFLELSANGSRASYGGLILLGIGGLGAAGVQGWLVEPWIVASYVVLGVVIVLMYALGTSYYVPIRQSLAGVAGTADVTPPSDAELVARLQTRRPELLTLVGYAGMAILIWLMVFKPGS
jgi:uncharacterized membrane protein